MRKIRGELDYIDPYVSTNGSIVLVFHSDGSIFKKGFSLRYRRKCRAMSQNCGKSAFSTAALLSSKLRVSVL